MVEVGGIGPGSLYGDHLKTFSTETPPQALAFAGRDERRLPSLSLPTLSQGQAAHQVTGAYARIGVGTNEQSIPWDGLHVALLLEALACSAG